MSTQEEQGNHGIVPIGPQGLIRPSSSLLQRGLELARRTRDHKTILVVEDDDVLLGELVDMFRKHGHNVLPAFNGKEALDIFVVDPSDIVVSNIHMPHLNGFQLLRAFRRLNPEVPIILTSGFYAYSVARKRFPEYWERIKKADAFFGKPFRLEALAACVEGFLTEPNLQTSSSQPTRKVLVVDCGGSGRTIANYFRWLGYRTFVAEDGQDGFELFLATRPDLLMTQPSWRIDKDRHLWTAVRDVSPETAIILWSGWERWKEELLRNPKFCGPITFMTGPFSIEALRAATERLLEQVS